MDHPEIKGTILSSILILLFEFIGTTFLTLLFTCNSGVSIIHLASKTVGYKAFIHYLINSLLYRNWAASFSVFSSWSFLEPRFQAHTITPQWRFPLCSAVTQANSLVPSASHIFCSKWREALLAGSSDISLLLRQTNLAFKKIAYSKRSWMSYWVHFSSHSCT